MKKFRAVAEKISKNFPGYFFLPHTVGSLIAARPGVESMTAWLQVRRPKRYATVTY